jgi:hypothetical protein
MAVRRLRRLAAFCDTREQDQDQSVEQKRDYQRGGVAKPQVFHEEFESTESDSRVCEPCELNPPLVRAKVTKGDGHRTNHHCANHGEAWGG